MSRRPFQVLLVGVAAFGSPSAADGSPDTALSRAASGPDTPINVPVFDRSALRTLLPMASNQLYTGSFTDTNQRARISFFVPAGPVRFTVAYSGTNVSFTAPGRTTEKDSVNEGTLSGPGQGYISIEPVSFAKIDPTVGLPWQVRVTADAPLVTGLATLKKATGPVGFLGEKTARGTADPTGLTGTTCKINRRPTISQVTVFGSCSNFDSEQRIRLTVARRVNGQFSMPKSRTVELVRSDNGTSGRFSVPINLRRPGLYRVVAYNGTIRLTTQNVLIKSGDDRDLAD